MAGITITGNKLLRTIRKEFEEQFPFLSLGFFTPEEWDKAREGGAHRVMSIRQDQRLAAVRLVQPNKDEKEISIHGRTLVKNLEAHFLKTFGLHVLVSYQEGDKRYFANEEEGAMSLTQLNNKLAEEDEATP